MLCMAHFFALCETATWSSRLVVRIVCAFLVLVCVFGCSRENTLWLMQIFSAQHRTNEWPIQVIFNRSHVRHVAHLLKMMMRAFVITSKMDYPISSTINTHTPTITFLGASGPIKNQLVQPIILSLSVFQRFARARAPAVTPLSNAKKMPFSRLNVNLLSFPIIFFDDIFRLSSSSAPNRFSKYSFFIPQKFHFQLSGCVDGPNRTGPSVLSSHRSRYSLFRLLSFFFVCIHLI